MSHNIEMVVIQDLFSMSRLFRPRQCRGSVVETVCIVLLFVVSSFETSQKGGDCKSCRYSFKAVFGGRVGFCLFHVHFQIFCPFIFVFQA